MSASKLRVPDSTPNNVTSTENKYTLGVGPALTCWYVPQE